MNTLPGSFALLGVEFAAPWALAALAIPAFVLLLARDTDAPPRFFTGAFELWLRLGARRLTEVSVRERGIPPHVWLFAAGLATAVLALAGPRPAWDAPREPWRALVDRSPSMYLSLDAGLGVETRLSAALRLAASVRSDADGDAAGVLWIDASANPPEIVLARTPPDAWLVPPRAPRAQLDWSRFDDTGALWITDDARALAPARASFAASGGPAVPGPVARRGSVRADWDGAQLREVLDAEHTSRVALDARVAEDVQRFVRAWAEARELAVVPLEGDTAHSSAVVLELRSAPARDVVAPGSERAAPIGRDGWTANARWSTAAPLEDGEGALESWLATRDGTPLVTAGPGRVHVALTALEEIAGDPASFAVSWSALCDGASLPGVGVVSLAERADAGGAQVRRQAPPPFASEFATTVARWRACLVIAALVLVAASLGWAWRSGRAR